MERRLKLNTNKDDKKTGLFNLILISYTNITDINIKEILKLKNNFLNLPARKIEEIYKMVKNQNKSRPKINITTKELLHYQIIIPVHTKNATKIVTKLSEHMVNINCLLKNIKSNIVANFIWADSKGIIITTNSITTESDLNLIEKYIKDIDIIQADIILTLCLS